MALGPYLCLELIFIDYYIAGKLEQFNFTPSIFPD